MTCGTNERGLRILIFAFVVFCVLSMVALWYQLSDSETNHVTRHKEVKGLVKDIEKHAVELNEETKQDLKKVDKKVDNLSIEVKKGHTLYLKDIESNKRLIQSNEQFYKQIYATMDTTAIDAVNRFNAEWFSKADSLKW